jgi:hypothetical protein
MVGEFKLRRFSLVLRNCLKFVNISPFLEASMFYTILHYRCSRLLSCYVQFLLLRVAGTLAAITNQVKHIHFHFIIIHHYIQ